MKTLFSYLRRPLVWLGIVTIYILPLLTLKGASDMFLKLAGITGESTDSKHSGEIDVLSWSWGASNSSSVVGGAGKANVQDLSVTKYVDKASPPLLLKTLNGGAIADATLTVRSASATPIEFLIIKLTNVLVTSISTGGSTGEDRLTENVSFNFGKVEFKYTPTDTATGKAGTPIITTWDVVANKP